MLVHAYFTNGFFPWAKLFLESFKFHNGEEMKVVLSTRELTDGEVEELYGLYKNLVVQNNSFDFEMMAKTAGVSVKKLLKLKSEIELNHVTEKNKVWKLMIAADDRVKSTFGVMKEYQDEGFMFHSDIDMYIRAPLTELFDEIKKHDISIRLRLHSKLNRKTMIGIQGYRLCKRTFKYLQKWIKYIDDVAPKDRPLGYGQTSSYYAYLDVIDYVDWWSVPRRFAAPQMYDGDIIWAGNTPKGKVKNLELCRNDFDKIKEGISNG